jgi:hypothetical protein
MGYGEAFGGGRCGRVSYHLVSLNRLAHDGSKTTRKRAQPGGGIRGTRF